MRPTSAASSIRLQAPVLAVGICVLGGALTGCSAVGVQSIGYGRTPYNEVIHDTASEQTLLNIIRVAHHEAPLFVDVTEVDQATSVTGSVTGGASGIGARGNPTTTQGTIAGLVGAVTGTSSYQEAPTVRYVPLSGQALIAQVSTPITPESMANLINSDWQIDAVLTLGVDRFTPGNADFAAAVNAIATLNNYGAIAVTATQGPEVERTARVGNLSLVATPPQTKDNLTFYFKRYHFNPEQASCDLVQGAQTERDAKRVVDAMWRRLQEIYRAGGAVGGNVGEDVITLSSKGSVGSFSASGNGGALRQVRPPEPQVLATRSALGVLKDAVEQDYDPSIAILRYDEVRYLIAEEKRRKGKQVCDDHFYTLDPKTFDRTTYQSGVRPTQADDEAVDTLRKRIKQYDRSLADMYPTEGHLTEKQLRAEKILLDQRRYMLVVQSKDRPSDAYVAVAKNGEWFSILADDDISKSTLALISQFNTIQAVPSQTPPLTPTISVGAR